MLFLTHVYSLTGPLVAGQNSLTRYVAASDPKGVDYRTSDGVSLSEAEIQSLVHQNVLRPLRPEPCTINADNVLLVNCVGGLYLADKNYAENRQPMQPIGVLLMTDKQLLPAA